MELRNATIEEARARDALTYQAWGAPQLTREEYSRREDFLRETAWSRTSLRPWVLVDAGQIVASCETYRMESRVGDLRGFSSGIASVFVEVRFRRRGFATRMMELLGSRLRAEGAQAGILFSEVGAEIYERSGYRVVPAQSRVWPARRSGAKAERLDDRALPAVLAAADRRPLSFRICVSMDQLAWHFARASYYARTLGKPAGEVRGFRSGRAWAISFPDLRNGRLCLLDVEPGDTGETEAVISAAADEAATLGLREVTVIENLYNAAGLPGGSTRECAEGVPMICSMAPGLAADAWRDVVRAAWV